MSEPWKLVNFNSGGVPYGSRLRIYEGSRVLLNEGHAVSKEVLQQIVTDHNLLLALEISNPALTIAHAHVYDYNRHGVMAFQAPEFEGQERLLLQALAKRRASLTIQIIEEKPE